MNLLNKFLFSTAVTRYTFDTYSIRRGVDGLLTTPAIPIQPAYDSLPLPAYAVGSERFVQKSEKSILPHWLSIGYESSPTAGSFPARLVNKLGN